MLGPFGTSDSMAAWSSTQCPFVIHYSRQIMTDIRLASLSGRFAIPRGGMEIGGILLGKRERDRIIVSAQKPLDCEHVFGPLFRLSDNDRLRMAALLSRSGSDGLIVLGWYRSVSRGSISLSDADVELYRGYFPERWSVALLVKPSLYSTSAGFFFREQDGSIRTDSSYREWQLDDEISSPQFESHMEAPKLEVANSVVAAEKQTQTPIDVPVPLPQGVLPTSPAPSPVREQPPSMSRTIWNVAALPTRRFPRVGLSLATFRRIRNAIRIAKPVTVGAILLFAALLFVWWNQRSAKSNIGISQGGGVRDTLRSTSRKGTSEAQAGTPSPPLIIRPDTSAVTETVVQTHDAAVAGAKPPTPSKRNAPFDPLVY
jgi:hypothetical protein